MLILRTFRIGLATLSIPALAAVFAAVPVSIDLSSSTPMLETSQAFAKDGHGKDDKAIHAYRERINDDRSGRDRHGNGSDDGAGHDRHGNGSDDGAGHDHDGHGSDDGSDHS